MSSVTMLHKGRCPARVYTTNCLYPYGRFSFAISSIYQSLVCITSWELFRQKTSEKASVCWSQSKNLNTGQYPSIIGYVASEVYIHSRARAQNLGVASYTSAVQIQRVEEGICEQYLMRISSLLFHVPHEGSLQVPLLILLYKKLSACVCAVARAGLPRCPHRVQTCAYTHTGCILVSKYTHTIVSTPQHILTNVQSPRHMFTRT